MFSPRKKQTNIKGPLWPLYSHILDGRILKKPDGTRGVVVSALHHDCSPRGKLAAVRLVRWEGSSKASAVKEEQVQAWLTDVFANETWVPESIRIAQLNKWAAPSLEQLPGLSQQLKLHHSPKTAKLSGSSPSPSSASAPHRALPGGKPSAANKRACRSLTASASPSSVPTSSAGRIAQAASRMAAAASPSAADGTMQASANGGTDLGPGQAGNAGILSPAVRAMWSMGGVVKGCIQALSGRPTSTTVQQPEQVAVAAVAAGGSGSGGRGGSGMTILQSPGGGEAGVVGGAEKPVTGPSAGEAAAACLLVAFDDASLQQLRQQGVLGQQGV